MSEEQSEGAKSQVKAVAELVVPKAPPSPQPEGANKEKPKVVFDTPLALTAEQETRMIDHALGRIENLEHELGRDTTSHANWYGKGMDDTVKQAAGSFMGKRQLYEMTFHNQIDWRAWLIGGIFAESNLTVPLSRRIAQQQIARAVNYFLGTDPWFGAYPVGKSDEVTADVTDKYCKHKAKESDLKGTIMSNVEGAIIRGETVTKTVHRQDWTQYQKEATIAIDAAGTPFVASDADYIYIHDEWVPMEVNAQSPESEEVPQQVWVLKRDGRTQLPESLSSPDQLHFETQIVPAQKVRYRGASSQAVYYKDFLAPLDAPNLDEAEICVHLYDKPAIEVASIYVAALEGEGQTTRETAAKIFESLQELTHLDDRPKAMAKKERPELGEAPGKTKDAESEQPESRDSGGEPIIEVAEVYMHFDANEDGVQEDIVLMIDRKNRRPLFYDYVQNRTPNGRRPFKVSRVNRVEGRWHGIGTMEVFQPLQEVVDLLVNRWNHSQSRSGNVIFWNPELTQEGEENPHLELNGGRTYTPKGNIDPETILKVIPLYDIKGREIYKEIEFFMQVAINMSGVSHVNDAAMLGMDTAKLATGVKNIERSGQEMFSIYLSQLQDGLEDILREFCIYTLAYLDHQEAFLYTENDQVMMLEFGPENVEQDINMDVRLEMTRYKNEQDLVQAQQATAKVIEYYTLPPELQMRTAQLYRQMLKAMQVAHVDEIIQPGFQIPPQGTPSGGSPGAPPGMGSPATDDAMPGQQPPNV
jgi:hypothetical protein